MASGKNTVLGHAKEAKYDEYYTQFADIEKEMNAYLDFNRNVFKDKTILLPCDDPEWSNFTKYFAQNFKVLGLKKLISTSYAIESKKYKVPYQPTLWEQSMPQFIPAKDKTHGKLYVLDQDRTGDGKIDLDDLHYDYLNGDGDFNSEEIKALRQDADIIVTNPPFSHFRTFMNWLVEGKKHFIIIANKNCVTYKEVFPLIKENKIWSGVTGWSGGMWFETKNAEDVDKVIDGINMKNIPSIWITNIDHGRRHEPLTLMNTADIFKFSKHKNLCGKNGFEHYDNYDAIEIPYTDSIPADYDGVMGVPISFLDKYDPEQFEILGITKTWFGGACKTYPEQIQISKNGQPSRVTKLNDGPALLIKEPPVGETYYKIGKKLYTQSYARILIRRREAGK